MKHNLIWHGYRGRSCIEGCDASHNDKKKTMDSWKKNYSKKTAKCFVVKFVCIVILMVKRIFYLFILIFYQSWIKNLLLH